MEYQSGGAYSNAPFHLLEFRLCHTPLATLTTNFQQNYGGNTPALVASADPYLVTAGLDEWFGFNCSPTFNYNGHDNLICEVRWKNTTTETEVDTWSYDCGTDRGLSNKGYNAETGTVSSKINRFRITFDDAGVGPTSLGRVKALFR